MVKILQFLVVVLIIVVVYHAFIKPFLNNVKNNGIFSALNEAGSDFMDYAEENKERVMKEYEQKQKQAERNRDKNNL